MTSELQRFRELFEDEGYAGTSSPPTAKRDAYHSVHGLFHGFVKL